MLLEIVPAAPARDAVHGVPAQGLAMTKFFRNVSMPPAKPDIINAARRAFARRERFHSENALVPCNT